MKIPLSWLKQYINIEITPGQIAKTLTNAGLEVDAIEKITPGFEHVVVARVIAVQKHPEADKLCLAEVTDGQETFHVVCGAPNCRPGIKTALAIVGATLKDAEGKQFKIKKSKIRGVDSFGMLCSSSELGLSKESDGIIEFAEHIKEGTDVAELYGDVAFEISLTPNLGHCQSLIGVARELSAATETPVKFPKIHVPESGDLIKNDVTLQVLNPEACPRYVCRLIKGVTVSASQDWLKARLEACGIRSVNNVVDVTNYVLLEMGHPLHAFDFNQIEGKGIVVRNAHAGERFVTLDDKERLLEECDLLICDKAKPVALAGIMGGLNSEVTESTKDILIESAYFAPSIIRKTSKRLGMFTDASKRFERGTDPNVLIRAVDRAAMLIEQVAGGHVSCGIIDVASKEFPEKQIKCRLTRINALLGTQLSLNEVENIFKRLELSFIWNGQDEFMVRAPTYRNDLQEEIDLVEEVARIYGYDNIKQATTRYASTSLPHAPIFLFERQVRSRLVSEGLQEFLTCNLIGPSLLDIVQGSDTPENYFVKVQNPTSVEQSTLRISLLPGLLQVIKYNWDHQNHNIAGFEIGRVHFKEGEHFKEQSVAGIILSGMQRAAHWDAKPDESDFFDLKGIVENLLKELQIKDISFQGGEASAFHPGRQASIYSGDLKVGMLGEVHPSIVRRLDVPQRLLFAEINLNDLLLKRETIHSIQDLPLYPGSERDWTITLSEDLPIANVFNAIKSANSHLLENVSLLDIYHSDKLGKGLKNATFRFLYRDQKKTISQEMVDNEHENIIKNVLSVIN
ncbi:MAG: phenylalanine--tRNA ligase subunit beta [Parachlamydiaceae bacterium]|nr:phenylalanine--tRNA ligase subunit beta [Parachlamydiaceae bacterium]